MQNPIMVSIFQKVIFELVYFCIFISIVLKQFYPIKAGYISEEDGGIVSEVYFFNLMVSYLYSFNSFISINEK